MLGDGYPSGSREVAYTARLILRCRAWGPWRNWSASYGAAERELLMALVTYLTAYENFEYT